VLVVVDKGINERYRQAEKEKNPVIKFFLFFIFLFQCLNRDHKYPYIKGSRHKSISSTLLSKKEKKND